MSVQPDPLMSTQDLAEYLGVPVGTVHVWRRDRNGPIGHRVGRHVRYRRDDVDEWLAGRRDHRPAS